MTPSAGTTARPAPAERYRFGTYVTKTRFASYWHQIADTMAFQPRRVLEIGSGPGIVADILAKQGIEVVTCDVADDIRVHFRASALALPLPDRSVDVVLCCQVLEHLPFEQFRAALQEIRRVCSKGAVISLPHSGASFPYQIYLPVVGRVRFSVKLGWRHPRHTFNGEHYWEIDKAGFSERTITRVFRDVFATVRTFRVHETPYHRFYVVSR